MQHCLHACVVLATAVLLVLVLMMLMLMMLCCVVLLSRYPLQLGWYVVKNPNQAALLRGTSSVAARQQEDMFFESSAPWGRLSSDQKSRLGEVTIYVCVCVFVWRQHDSITPAHAADHI